MWELYNLYFLGSRDKRGGAVLIFPANSAADRIKYDDLRSLVTYLASVPRSVSYESVGV